MANKKFTVLDLLNLDLSGHDTLDLRCIAGRRGLPRAITIAEINRPGLALCGFYEGFANNRVQLFGRGETAYLEKLINENQIENLITFFERDIPCCVFSYNLEPPAEFLELAEKYSCPVLQTSHPSTEFSNRIIRTFSNIFAPKQTMHGVLVEVYGIGILLTGHSGVGKSETALELVERGHRLVADDIIEIRCVNGNTLLGTFSVNVEGKEITDGYNTLDTISWLDDTFEFTDETAGINRFATGDTETFDISDLSKEIALKLNLLLILVLDMMVIL